MYPSKSVTSGPVSVSVASAFSTYARLLLATVAPKPLEAEGEGGSGTLVSRLSTWLKIRPQPPLTLLPVPQPTVASKSLRLASSGNGGAASPGRASIGASLPVDPTSYTYSYTKFSTRKSQTSGRKTNNKTKQTSELAVSAALEKNIVDGMGVGPAALSGRIDRAGSSDLADRPRTDEYRRILVPADNIWSDEYRRIRRVPANFCERCGEFGHIPSTCPPDPPGWRTGANVSVGKLAVDGSPALKASTDGGVSLAHSSISRSLAVSISPNITNYTAASGAWPLSALIGGVGAALRPVSVGASPRADPPFRLATTAGGLQVCLIPSYFDALASLAEELGEGTLSAFVCYNKLVEHCPLGQLGLDLDSLEYFLDVFSETLDIPWYSAYSCLFEADHEGLISAPDFARVLSYYQNPNGGPELVLQLCNCDDTHQLRWWGSDSHWAADIDAFNEGTSSIKLFASKFIPGLLYLSGKFCGMDETAILSSRRALSISLSPLAREFIPCNLVVRDPPVSLPCLLESNRPATFILGDPLAARDYWLERFRVFRMGQGLFNWEHVLSHPSLYKKAKRRWAQSLPHVERSRLHHDKQLMHLRHQEMDAIVRRKRRNAVGRRPARRKSKRAKQTNFQRQSTAPPHKSRRTRRAKSQDDHLSSSGGAMVESPHSHLRVSVASLVPTLFSSHFTHH